MLRSALVVMISKEHGLQTTEIPMKEGEKIQETGEWIERKVRELGISAGWRVTEIISH